MTATHTRPAPLTDEDLARIETEAIALVKAMPRGLIDDLLDAVPALCAARAAVALAKAEANVLWDAVDDHLPAGEDGDVIYSEHLRERVFTIAMGPLFDLLIDMGELTDWGYEDEPNRGIPAKARLAAEQLRTITADGAATLQGPAPSDTAERPPRRVVDAGTEAQVILTSIPPDQIPDAAGLLGLALEANEACRAAVDASHQVFTHFVEPLIPHDLAFDDESDVAGAIKASLHLDVAEAVLLDAVAVLAEDGLLCAAFRRAQAERIDLTPARALLAELRQEATR